MPGNEHHRSENIDQVHCDWLRTGSLQFREHCSRCTGLITGRTQKLIQYSVNKALALFFVHYIQQNTCYQYVRRWLNWFIYGRIQQNWSVLDMISTLLKFVWSRKLRCVCILVAIKHSSNGLVELWRNVSRPSRIRQPQYGCRNGAKFNILKFYSYLTFIDSYLTFVSIQHHYLFKIQHLYWYSTVLFVHKIIIHSETIYPFNNFLFIQDLLRISLTHGSDVLSAADEQGAAKKCKRSLELWKDTDRFCTELSEERLRRSEHLRLCLITLRRCSSDFLQIFFASSKPEKNAKACCTQSEKLMVSLTLRWARGFLFFSCLWKAFISN